uniref:Uncharacterized protein n=1 Tax=Equus asinus TaxID=9793 RepID=A0A9L0KKK1_EQUAS
LRPRPRGWSRARDLLRTLPRVSLANLKPNPGSRKLARLHFTYESQNTGLMKDIGRLFCFLK